MTAEQGSAEHIDSAASDRRHWITVSPFGAPAHSVKLHSLRGRWPQRGKGFSLCGTKQPLLPCDFLGRRDPQRDQPLEDLILEHDHVLAMTQHQLGKKDEAKATLGRLREIMKQPRWARFAESVRFLRDAEKLIEGKAAGKGQ